MILASKKQQELTPVTEVHTIKLYHTSIDAAYNGSQEVEETDSGLPVDTSKHLELKEGDAHALYNYFCRMKLTNPNFFYLMDLDDEGCLRNAFWADARSRAAFNSFSDAVAIDTTSLRNKYEIPLISFVGLNNHGQPVLLGCGFLGHDSAEYFIWMLKSWQTCMLGRHPQVILTDQSKSLQIAVSKLFPRACHCYCLSYESIKMQLYKAVYNSLKITEFESSWGQMIGQHGLKDSKWLQSLYEDREKWVPVYFKRYFLHGNHANKGKREFGFIF